MKIYLILKLETADYFPWNEITIVLPFNGIFENGRGNSGKGKWLFGSVLKNYFSYLLS